MGTHLFRWRDGCSAASGDADGDGLSHLEEYYLGTNPLLADTDGDDVDDRIELLADTDPIDERSFFAARMVTPLANGVQVRWSTVYGRSYKIEASAFPDGPWSNLTMFSMTEYGEYPEGQEMFIDTGSSNQSFRLYRVLVLPEDP